MDEREQARERRIGALRQVVSMLRGKRDKASDVAAAGWATELEKLADEESVEAHASDRRLAYRNVVAYLRSELGLDRDKVKEMLGQMVQGLITTSIKAIVDKEVADYMGRWYGSPPAKLQNLVDARVKELVSAAVEPAIKARVSEMVMAAFTPKGG